MQKMITHYIYASTDRWAVAITKKLKENGFLARPRLSADGENWLILASHEAEVSLDSITSLQEMLSGLVSDLGGDYDGWEIDTTQ